MSCLWDRSPVLSIRLKLEILLLILDTPAFGKAFLPSNNSTNKRSTKRIVSKQHLKTTMFKIFLQFKLILVISVGNVFFSYLTILASCFKIVLAKFGQNIKINCCKIRPRLENYDFLTFTFLLYIKSTQTQFYLISSSFTLPNPYLR